MKSLFLFSDSDSVLHRLDPRAKFLGVLAVLTYVLVFNDPLYITAMFGCIVAALWLLGGISPFEYWTVLLLFSPLVIAVTLIQGLTNHPPGAEMAFVLGPIRLSEFGVSVGLSVGTRLATMGLVFMLFSMTTSPKKVGLALSKSGVPFKYAYLATFGLRFLPLMQRNLNTLQDARATRADPNSGSRNPARRLLSLPKTFFPLAANSLRQSAETAKALELRGYGSTADRTVVSDIQMRPTDFAVAVAAVLASGTVVYLRVAYGIGTRLTA
jgi:energy-coupling factor transport system permease protein